MSNKPTISIIISSFNRLPLFRRSLWAIANRPPSLPFEVVVVDDGSTEDILGELKTFSSAFLWKFIEFNAKEFEEKTGLKKFHNNPAVTQNIGFKHASGDLIFQQGNEVIAWEGCYDKVLQGARSYWSNSVTLEDLLADDFKHAGFENFIVFSTTFDVPQQHLNKLDQYGQNLNEKMIRECYRWPLQSKEYRSDVTNYISLAPRSLWEAIQGFDERYYAGISAEDSDFVRRARALPGCKTAISEGISLHQSHFGKTLYYDPPPHLMGKERWEEGCKINHRVYNSWAGGHSNPQEWPWGTYGVGKVTSNH